MFYKYKRFPIILDYASKFAVYYEFSFFTFKCMHFQIDLLR